MKRVPRRGVDFFDAHVDPRVRRSSSRCNTRTQETTMRFMMIVKPPAYTGLPDPAQFEAMGRYNDELQRAGVLLDLNGLAPAAQGVRVQFRGSTRTVSDGPFSEAKELIGGYWIIQVRSK